jgi:hypothetical protein
VAPQAASSPRARDGLTRIPTRRTRHERWQAVLPVRDAQAVGQARPMQALLDHEPAARQGDGGAEPEATMKLRYREPECSRWSVSRPCSKPVPRLRAPSWTSQVQFSMGPIRNSTSRLLRRDRSRDRESGRRSSRAGARWPGTRRVGGGGSRSLPSSQETRALRKRGALYRKARQMLVCELALALHRPQEKTDATIDRILEHAAV